MDWREVFIPSVPVVEILLRGTITYLSLVVMLRFVLKRETGAVGIPDLLLLVLIADAAQNAMSGGYVSVTDGILLVGTILFWNYSLDWLGHYFPKTFGRILRAPPLILIKDGIIIWKNLRKELITKEELLSELRERGIEDINRVSKMFIEGDGSFSIILKEKNDQVKEGERLEGDHDRHEPY